ncbi:hypothetical protein MA04_00693 [Alcanivorax balearicus MACL04]|uniref:PAAR domain-containing protein n=1 Tax=Alloalcanivorax balearicus MACL04 TaxID=1177182 RepID=A0ABT2QV67_9GAMM|nr:PAAR domain-containing protein [Alloalcanivorax balearicus]MCU5781393.1 hypothetical protein [Alloalcanivorax balearicus MACL04]
MSRPIIVLGDKTDHGGTVIGASITTDIEGKGIARVGDPVICPKCNKLTHIISGDPTNREDGKEIARHGDKTSCGAMLISSQATTGIDPGAGARGSDLGGVAAGLATLVGQSNAIITASTTAASAAASILSGQTQSSSPTGQSYPLVEEGEEEEEIGESEMGPNGPKNHHLALIIRALEMEVEKQKGILGAGELAENADGLLSLVELARPTSILKVLKASMLDGIERALRKGTDALRDASVQGVRADLERSKMHLRRYISRLEAQIEELRARQQARDNGTEKFTEFQAAQEREALERYLDDAFDRYYSEIKNDVVTAKDNADDMRDECDISLKELTDYENSYLGYQESFDKEKYDALQGRFEDCQNKRRILEGRLVESEKAFKSIQSDKTAFRNKSIEEKAEMVDKLKNVVVRKKLDAMDSENPFKARN